MRERANDADNDRRFSSPDPGALCVRPALETLCQDSCHDFAVLFADVSSDLETPVSALMKLRGEGPCFLLESAESGRMWGRYSFLGFDPVLLVSIEDDTLVLSGDGESRMDGRDPVRAFFELVDGFRVLTPADETPFAGGAVGYFGYEILPALEGIRLSRRTDRVPPMRFMFPGRLVAFDHLRSRIRLCALAPLGRDAGELAAGYEKAADEIRAMARALDSKLPAGGGIDVRGRKSEVPGDELEHVESNVTRGEFEEMVARAREYILAGDAYQIVASQRFSMRTSADPLTVYRHLRADNPSPYMFYLRLPEVTLVGSSPEPLVTNRQGKAIIRPIAGTRPRGCDAAADEALSEELRADEKERAEHVMLVDLARNDLGRVAVPGSVRVRRLMEVERFSHVMHLVSEVEAELAEGSGNYDLLKASFPAGTVVGAPKVRASQLVDVLEPDPRGIYAGALGYLSYSGDMDLCITIRTIAISGGKATVQAGAGIVADSVPANEYEETRNKARALVRALLDAGEA